MESMGEFESPQLRDHEKAIIMEDIRLRWIFFTNQFFTDWELWSKFPLPVILLHIRQLVRRVKTNRRFYCQNLPISSLLTAAGFYFWDVKTLFSFAESSAHPDVISEVVVLIGKIFDRAGANDQFTLLTYEQGVADKLYTVILSPSSKVHVTAKINALKVCAILSWDVFFIKDSQL
ncbi:unnamed protein product [Dibothriocephalus latus]|uniref:Uncharacterized protein n=1 Tax=Dibothriocephalus latus TaxID=60516 RepID=A0A3P7LNW6_DIBLA|nr:unnamed protein product [Dibothriocephalus latus]